MAVRQMSMVEAVRDALDVMMTRDPRVIVFGEDVGYFGGVFRCTQGLQQKHGKLRCFDTPISESGIVGTAIGMDDCEHQGWARGCHQGQTLDHPGR